jgi:uncharacterized iron-regulated membrane protein
MTAAAQGWWRGGARGLRGAARLSHRWLGLALGVPLLLAGLSGTALVYEHEIDASLNPQLFHNQVPCGSGLDADAIVARLRAHWMQARVSQVAMPSRPGASYRLRFQAPGVTAGEAMLDGCSGALLGSRDRAVAGIDALHLMPTLQAWHLNLLQGKAGRTALGYLALAWLLMSAAGVLLAWPRPGTWRRTLRVRLDQHAYRSHVDLHRSIGLLSSVLMVAAAFTSVYNGWPEQTRAVAAHLLPMEGTPHAIARPALGTGETAIGWNAARAIAEQHAGGGAILLALNRLPQRGLYLARLLRPDDRQRTGTLRLFIDMRDGSLAATADPLSGTLGERFLAALYPWHSGQLGGLGGRLAAILSGLLPALFFITGLTTWILRRNIKRR